MDELNPFKCHICGDAYEYYCISDEDSSLDSYSDGSGSDESMTDASTESSFSSASNHSQISECELDDVPEYVVCLKYTFLNFVSTIDDFKKASDSSVSIEKLDYDADNCSVKVGETVLSLKEKSVFKINDHEWVKMYCNPCYLYFIKNRPPRKYVCKKYYDKIDENCSIKSEGKFRSRWRDIKEKIDGFYKL